MADTDELAMRLQGMPAEIFNYIFDLTIAVGDDVLVDRTYKPPIGLQLSHETREAFALAFYSKTSFHSDCGTDPSTLENWLAALPSKHINLLRTVRMDIFNNTDASPDLNFLLKIMGLEWHLLSIGNLVLSRSGRTKDAFLQRQCWERDGDGWKTMDYP